MNTALASLALLVVGTSLAAAALLSAGTGLRLLAVSLASAGTGSWLVANHPIEGRVLLVLAPGNGLTSGDLLALPAVLLVGALLMQDVLARRRRRTP